MNVIFAGTPEFATPTLRALCGAHEVVAVYTQPDRRAGRGKKLLASPVKQLAEQQDIPVYQPTSLKDEVERIRALEADVMVVVAYGMLLPPSILELPRLGCINVHASILPHWRGAAPIQRSIEAGDTETGVSIMRMEAGLDTGPVFKVLTTPIEEDDTSASMHNKLADLGAQGLSAVLEVLSHNPQLQPEPQAHEQASYAKKISKGESEVDWHASASEIHCKLRAFIPWPVCQTWHGEDRLRLWQARVIDDQSKASPGTVIAIAEDGIVVACGSGSLMLQKLQRDGGTKLDCREFLNGYPLSPGEKLGLADA